jgi:uncharacterized phage-associated protein
MLTKQMAFEFFCHQIYAWYTSNRETEKNDLSVLKVMKLLFFISAFKREDNSDLLDIFNNFQAMTYGPVELDIYNDLPQINSKSSISINREFLTLKDGDIQDSDGTELDSVNKSIYEFRTRFPEFVTLEAFKLVDISHRWSCWARSYDTATLEGRGLWPIDVQSIREDKQYFGME